MDCPHKDKKWYEVPLKNDQYKRMHSTRKGPKPVTYCTTCGTWRYDSMQGHLAKDHAEFEESSKKVPKKEKKKL
eukprot:4147255-Ditylum_brightwellii.AAC.1